MSTSMSGPIDKTFFAHPNDKRRLGIVEVKVESIPALLGFDSSFKLKDIELVDQKLRIKLQHPLFPIHKEGECITIIPLITK